MDDLEIEEIKNKCTLLVNGYDKGNDLWPGFFKCLTNNWKDIPLNIVLNTESKTYSYKGLDIKTFSLFREDKKVSWSKRLKETLRRIDTKYVLFMLDDFWLEKQVDEFLIYKTIKYLDENSDISNFSFENKKDDVKDDGKFNEYYIKQKHSDYKLSCQAGLWRREKLISYLNENESAWEWEVYGNFRTYKLEDKFYCLKENIESPLQYNGGWVVYRGKWTKSVVDKYVERYNIEIDYTKRGILDENITNKFTHPLTLMDKLTYPNLIKRTCNSIRYRILRLFATKF